MEKILRSKIFEWGVRIFIAVSIVMVASRVGNIEIALESSAVEVHGISVESLLNDINVIKFILIIMYPMTMLLFNNFIENINSQNSKSSNKE